MQLLSLVGSQPGDLGINSILPHSVVYPPGVTTTFKLFNFDTVIAGSRVPIYQDYNMNDRDGSVGESDYGSVERPMK
jgi:hypothetical protein